MMPAAFGVLDLAGAVTEMVTTLEAAGVTACADQRDLNPPACYVAPPSIAWNRLEGWTGTVDLYAVVPATGRVDALSALGPLVDAIVAVYPASVGYPIDLQPLDGTDPLPAYRLPVSIHVTT
jgi:hypothetical protein